MNTVNNKFGGISYITLLIMLLMFTSTCVQEKIIELPVPELDSITDAEGNIYKTVKIGDQWWMAEDLRVKRYSNGDSITFINTKNFSIEFDSARWKSIKDTGTYCKGAFGLLYNWYAVKDTRNIAPAGWHVPTDYEWKKLEIYLGMGKEVSDSINWRGTNEGNKLKIQGVGLTSWTTPDNKYKVWGSNESGLSALPDGCMMFNGIPGNPGPSYTGFWWTTSEQNGEAWYRYLDYNKPNVFRFYGPKNYGFSIRCVKDVSIGN